MVDAPAQEPVKVPGGVRSRLALVPGQMRRDRHVQQTVSAAARGRRQDKMGTHTTSLPVTAPL